MNKTLGMILITLVCTYTEMQTAHAEDRFAAIEVTTQQITDRIHVLFGAGGNIGVSKGSDGLLMIDDQFAPLAPKIKAALQKLGEESPVYLLNTHYHGDHVGGNGIFGTDSLIIAHQNVRLRLLASDPPKNFADVSLPVITYEKRANLYFNGEEIQLIPTSYSRICSIFEGSHSKACFNCCSASVFSSSVKEVFNFIITMCFIIFYFFIFVNIINT